MMCLRPVQILRTQATDWLTLDEAKAHLHVTWTEQDSEISAFLDTSAKSVRDFVGRPVVDETVVYSYGPAVMTPQQLIVPGVDSGYTLGVDPVQVSQDGGPFAAQAFKALPLYSSTRRELTIDLVDPPSFSDDARGQFTVTLTAAAPADGTPDRAVYKTARLMLIGALFEAREGEGIDPQSWLRAYRHVLHPHRSFL